MFYSQGVKIQIKSQYILWFGVPDLWYLGPQGAEVHDIL